MLRTILLTLVGLATAFIASTQAVPASALTVDCGDAVCSVSSTVRGESDWREVVASQPPANTNTSTDVVSITTCSSWLPRGGGQSISSSYPVQNSNTYDCYFPDSGATGGNNAEVFLVCPPAPDRSANGRATVFTRLADGTLVYKYFFCLYPTDPYAPVERLIGSGKIYVGGEGIFSHTDLDHTGRLTPGGTITDRTGYIIRGFNPAIHDPADWVGAWTPAFNARTGTQPNGNPLWGYYRLDWVLDYRICDRYAYPSWLGQPTRLDCSRTGTDRTSDPFTYSCALTPPLQPGIILTSFSPLRCAEGLRVCEVFPDTIQNRNSNLTVMRNGDPLTVQNPTPRVEATNPSFVRNITWTGIYRTVVPGSTPFEGTNPNASNQLFTSSWQWGRWENPRNHQDGTIAFYWASDSNAGFRWNTAHQFRAEMFVFTQQSLNAPPRREWVSASFGCQGNQPSPTVSVVRSINNP